MGRHSRRGPAPQGSERSPENGTAPDPGARTGGEGQPAARPAERPGTGRRRRTATGFEQYRTQPDQAQPQRPAPYGTPFGDAQEVRGGHPEPQPQPPRAQQPRPGGYGDRQYGDRHGAPRAGLAHPAAAGTAAGAAAGTRIPGPRREFLDAFDRAPGRPAAEPEPGAPGRGPAAGGTGSGQGGAGDGTVRSAAGGGRPVEGVPVKSGTGGPGKGRTLTGVAAAAVTTVLAVVVAGQVGGTGQDRDTARPPVRAAERAAGHDPASRSDGHGRSAPSRAVPPPPAPATYDQLMTRRFPLDPRLRATGVFQAVPGLDKAPGQGRKVRYRVDVEKGLALDAGLFAQAVHKTLNDERSWAHGGAMTFERVSTGAADFVVTLASPGTTAVWCAKSGLDTTIDNVSCDSAATERVMVNAYRWAQGSPTYGVNAMHPYRQMLINHEVGHRLGHNHVSCRTPGALAPVMQQQTKSLEIDGVKCRPNPWVFPGG
ncbi:DUF3152 domain-containing protein [Streptomyces sp. HMX112]|uniref:DUF3152 domain-containing protein n=1 Tax=Streptomyces sp. HMX112 TaxID=3390850 RepID=UPI003A7FD827